MERLVSIVMPMYNAEMFVAEAIESVIFQDYACWELLIVDDCSTDGSVALVEDWIKNEPKIRLINSDINGGPAAARNLGIKAAKGTYLAFLDSDDYWHKNKLSRQLSFMRTGKLVTYTGYQKVTEQRASKGKPIHARTSVTYSQLLNSNDIPCLTAMYNLKGLGKRYMKPVGHEDYVYWLSILKEGTTAYGLNEVLAYYRVRSGSVSNDKFKAAGFQWNIYRNIENLSLFKSFYHFVIYTYRGIKKQRIDIGANA